MTVLPLSSQAEADDLLQETSGVFFVKNELDISRMSSENVLQACSDAGEVIGAKRKADPFAICKNEIFDPLYTFAK
jgi:hypothetical protein